MPSFKAKEVDYMHQDVFSFVIKYNKQLKNNLIHVFMNKKILTNLLS